MSHPRDLIDRIKVLLEAEYAPAVHGYVFERAIPGTRMMPDIAIWDVATNSLRCVVEIGYTRPEKLTAYRSALNVPDVRWYGKDGTLHTPEPDRKSLRVEVALEPRGGVFCYDIAGETDCPDCLEDCPDCFDLRDEQRAGEVTVILTTDYVHAWALCACDECGSVWFADEHDWGIIYLSAKLFFATINPCRRAQSAPSNCSSGSPIRSRPACISSLGCGRLASSARSASLRLAS